MASSASRPLRSTTLSTSTENTRPSYTVIGILLSQLVQHALQIGRQFARELHPSPVPRLLEHEPGGVQERPRATGGVGAPRREGGAGPPPAGAGAVPPAVKWIADDRMADGAQVYADLMRT